MVILAVGPHPDDIEFGCYGTLAKFKSIQKEDIHLLILTNGSNGGESKERTNEAKKSAALINARIMFLDENDGYVKNDASTVRKIKSVIDAVSPRIIFFPFYKDTHQDHVACSLSVISASHGKESLLMYETPSTYEMEPSVFCDVSDYVNLKLESLKCHRSQLNKIYFDENQLMSRMIYWGWKNRRRAYLEHFSVKRHFLMDRI